MKIIDTYNLIDSCFANDKFDIDLWKEYSNSILVGLSEKLMEDSKYYDFKTEILPVIDAFIKNKEKSKKSHLSFLKIVENLPQTIIRKFEEDMDVTIILYLGLCNGAGWATEINGQKIILLGIEKIVELDWCNETSIKGLIYHELGHIFHNKQRLIRDELKSNKEKALFQLYFEGFAMYVEQLLCDNYKFYHQNVDNWLDWCKRNQKRLYQAYLTKINNNESTQEFFGDWNSIEGKSDIGYYLGCELIKDLSSQYSLKELANLEVSDFEKHLRQRCENE